LVQIARPRYFSIGYRLLYLAGGVAAFLGAYLVGAALPLSEQEAEHIVTEFTEKVDDIDEAGIFLNNIGIALAMFVPGAGVGVGVYSGVSTGTVFHAFTLGVAELQDLHPLSVIATPFGILEILAYGLAISRSGMLVAQLAKRGRMWKEYTIPTLVEIGIVVAALVAGSLIESQAIEAEA
jgi:Kef-type K+ transport system membrane component KefB